MSVVSLTHHRNTEWKRKQHLVSEALVQSARTAGRMKGVAGFVLVAWDGNGHASVSCDLSAEVFPPRTAPEFVYSELKDALK